MLEKVSIPLCQYTLLRSLPSSISKLAVGQMLEKVSIPWLDLLRVFARLRRKRIRSFSFKHDVGVPLTTSPREKETEKVRGHEVRTSVFVLGLLNCTVAVMSTCVAVMAALQDCPQTLVMAADLITAAACLRLLWMLGMGFTQARTASAMHGEPTSSHRSKRRKWYKLWLWWSRLGYIVTALQGVGALYFALLIATISAEGFAYRFSCGRDPGFRLWLVVTPASAWAMAVTQCCVGSDVIAWRSLYHNHGDAWRAHYREMFDYGIREFLCCLGRRQYLSQSEKDEVDTVAALIGELLEYRAGGASHLEVAAGVALLREQQHEEALALNEDENKAVLQELLSEGARLHPYAVAAYTGFLMEFCRNPFTWICVWLRRQGILTFWKRNRRPILEGDNWWRGHAAAFLRNAELPPEALLQGRVSQRKSGETVYFVAALHHLRTIVVAVRGTETPEDMLIDGLADRECELSDSDLLGLLQGDGVSEQAKKQVVDSMPHYCHKGVIHAARELSMQLDNLAEDESAEQALIDCASFEEIGDSEVLKLERRQGLLTELLGPGGKYQGYSLRFVGHSLGGAIATLTALRLYKRYPDLHVYTYGVLPCVDSVTADACAGFVTSVIYNDEFSSRLSVASIMRLRAAALGALRSNSELSNPTAWFLLGRASDAPTSDDHVQPQSLESDTEISEQFRKESKGDGDEEQTGVIAEQAGKMKEDMGIDIHDIWPEEMYVPGLVIHLVKKNQEEPQTRESRSTLESACHFVGCLHEENEAQYYAILKDRKCFQDIVVSPDMFIDHAPWRCQHAMDEILMKWGRTPGLVAANVPTELV